MTPTPTRPEPTTPTREERIIERLCGAFEGLLKSWQRTAPDMTENEVLALCRPSERDAYMLALWARQRLTSEPAGPTSEDALRAEIDASRDEFRQMIHEDLAEPIASVPVTRELWTVEKTESIAPFERGTDAAKICSGHEFIFGGLSEHHSQAIADAHNKSIERLALLAASTGARGAGYTDADAVYDTLKLLRDSYFKAMSGHSIPTDVSRKLIDQADNVLALIGAKQP